MESEVTPANGNPKPSSDTLICAFAIHPLRIAFRPPQLLRPPRFEYPAYDISVTWK